MYRLFVVVMVAVSLLTAFRPMPETETVIDDVGCIYGDARFDYQMIHRIVIWEGNNLTYLEEVPCGSNNWFERHSTQSAPPSGTQNPGVFTSEGTVEFSATPDVAGTITPGTGPNGRGFAPDSTSGKLVISAPVVQSLLASIH